MRYLLAREQAYRSLPRAVLVVFMAAIGASCSQNPDKPESGTLESVMQEAKTTQEKSTALDVPDEVSEALLQTSMTNNTGAAREARFDVSVNRVPARTFFVSLVADAGVNVVAHPEVSGVISLELRDVTIEEVLEVTREVYGYEFRFKNGIYTIYPRKLRTQIFPINYLDIQRVGVTDTSVQIGEINSNSSGGRNGNTNNSGNNNSQSGGGNASNLFSYLGDANINQGGSQALTPGARVQTLTKTNFWEGIRETIVAIVGEGEGRMVMTNPQAGLVVVKALPDELRGVREFLEKSELSVKRQVVLETKILEVRLNDGFKAGINWSAIGGALSLGQTDTSDQSLAELFSGGASQTQSFATSVLNVTDITKLLFLLEKQGKVQVLSSPRISTVNNQKAVIRVGTDEFFVTGLSNSTTASASSVVSTPEVELDSFFSGIALDVTPQISADGSVILHVHPIVTEVTDQTKEIDIAGELFSLPLALRDVRESDSIVKARSGQVVVLGGLMQETSSDIDTKRAFLGNIPVLNVLFKAKEKATVKTELVILMKPVVVGEDTWNEQISEQDKRFSDIPGAYQSR